MIKTKTKKTITSLSAETNKTQKNNTFLKERKKE